MDKRDPVKYTLKDVGCYVDEARGIYSTDHIYTIAVVHGFKTDETDWPGTLSEYEFANEVEDEINDFMNDKFPVEGAYWGRSEQGDWGLWSSEED